MSSSPSLHLSAGAAASGASHDHHQAVVQNLVHMANHIGEFFAPYPERKEAVDGVATHLRRYWEPRMRRQLYAHLDAHAADSGLSDLVLEAARVHRAVLEPAR